MSSYVWLQCQPHRQEPLIFPESLSVATLWWGLFPLVWLHDTVESSLYGPVPYCVVLTVGLGFKHSAVGSRSCWAFS